MMVLSGQVLQLVSGVRGWGGLLTVRFLCTVVELGVLPSGKEIGVDDIGEAQRRVHAPRRDQVTGLSSLLLLCTGNCVVDGIKK